MRVFIESSYCSEPKSKYINQLLDTYFVQSVSFDENCADVR